jgi:hypothetical protein
VRTSKTPQQHRRAELAAADAEVYAQVMERDGRTCLACGTRDRPTLQHILPRGAGGTSRPLDPRLAVVLCGSGTTGCHGLVEHEGRYDGWAYDLFLLVRHGAEVDALLADPDATLLVWGPAAGVWWELFVSGVRTARPDLAPCTVETPWS